MKRNLVFIGGGCRGRQSLTLGGIAAMREVNAILFFPFEDIDASWISTIALSGTPVLDLSALYLDDAIDRDNYDRVRAFIVESLDQYPSVAVVMPGHPLLGVTVASEYCDRPPRGCEVKIVDGISSFDTICTDLRRDPLDCGTVVIDANRMLLYEQIVDCSLDLVIYHVCSVGNRRTEYSNPAKSNRIDLLRRFLLKNRDPDTPAFLVESRALMNIDGVRWRGTVATLEDSLDLISFASTLVVMGTRDPPVGGNGELLESLLASE